MFLAQVNPVDFGRSFREAEANFHWSNAALVVACIVAIGLAFSLAVRYLTWREGRRYRHPHQLFAELCRAHGLDRASRKRLQRLASAHKLADPARIFLEPERFETTQLGASFNDDRAALEALRDLIFSYQLSETVVEA
jgi:hypothetical protein